MAEPTLKDVLHAISKLATKEELVRLEKGQASLEARLGALETGQDGLSAQLTASTGQLTASTGQLTALTGQLTALTGQLTALTGEVAAHRKETAAGFKEINEHFDGHITAVHRDLEDDVAALHKDLVRAKVPGVPKELPSQVRAKGARPSRPAKKTTARRG